MHSLKVPNLHPQVLPPRRFPPPSLSRATRLLHRSRKSSNSLPNAALGLSAKSLVVAAVKVRVKGRLRRTLSRTAALSGRRTSMRTDSRSPDASLVAERLVDSPRAEPAEAEVDREPEVLRGAGVMVVVVVVVLEATEAFEEVTQVRLSMVSSTRKRSYLTSAVTSHSSSREPCCLSKRSPSGSHTIMTAGGKSWQGRCYVVSQKKLCFRFISTLFFLLLSFGMRYDA
jgi:hypothetical protein